MCPDGAATLPAPAPSAREAWPPDYVAVWAQRLDRLRKIQASPALAVGALHYYATRPVEFIEHWCDTYDPRNAGSGIPARLPFILFQRQREFLDFLQSCVADEAPGLVEKCRDVGATWLCCAYSVWSWLFVSGASIGWGSRKEQLVDKLGDPDSIFEKMRMTVRGLPRLFLPSGYDEKTHLPFMKFINPENGATITGEAGDNIGRGGRKTLFFKDESAHYERPEKIEAALADTTRVQIDISSVNGVGNVFHRRRESGIDWFPGAQIEPHKTRVFVFDWRDHPAKSDAWYRQRRARAEAEGLLHLFEQEVNRNYAAAMQGAIIPLDWIKAAIDAHIALGIAEGGGYGAALDVADDGQDRNALVVRRGIVLTAATEWSARDVAVTARHAVGECAELGPVDLQYDCIGVGAAVKAETNNLRAAGALPRRVRLVPWSAAASPQDPDGHVVKGDKESPRNRDFFANLKAQGWWELRQRFYRTYRMREGLATYDHDTLISIDSRLPLLRQIEKELSQPTADRSAAMKWMVNKTPEGTRSPNIADAAVMVFWPIKLSSYTLENV